DFLSPGYEPGRRPLRVLTMRVWHVLRAGCMAALLAVRTSMGCDSLSLEEHLDRGHRGAHVDDGLDLVTKLIGHGVVVAFVLDVVVDVDRRSFEGAVDEPLLRQRLEVRSFEALEQRTSADSVPLHGTVVEVLEQLGD